MKNLGKNPVAQNQYILQRTEELQNAQKEKERVIKNKADNQYRYLNTFFKFFYVGRAIDYPTVGIDGNIKVKGIFTGYKIDYKRKNPFAPSAVSLTFALADSTRYISLVCSGNQGIQLNAIIGASLWNCGV